MHVRELDAATAADDELLALHALEEACAPPGEPFREPALSLAYYRHWPAGTVRRRWVVTESGELAGSAVLQVHGPALVYADVLVQPALRRRGIGTALLESLCGAARELGLGSLFGHHWDEAGAAFATEVGAKDDQRDGVDHVTSSAPCADYRLTKRSSHNAAAV